MTDESRITFRAPEELHLAAKEKAKDSDIALSLVLRWYLRAWVEGRAPMFPPTEPSKKESKNKKNNI